MLPRRRLAALTLAALLAASCGSDDDGGVERSESDGVSTTSSTTAPDSTTDGASTGGPSSTDPAADGTTSTSTGSTTTGPTTSGTSATTAAPTTGSAPPATTAPSTGARPLNRIDLALEPVASFSVPTAYRAHPNGKGFVAEKVGRIRDIANGSVALDVRTLVVDNREQGFLGFAFSDDGATLYVSYSDRDSGGDTLIAEYAFDGTRAVTSTRRVLLQLDQPYANHNGGDIHIGPDGLLYIALGDGGSGGDPDGNGQDTDTLLGSILRIDPTTRTGSRAYGIPATNPFRTGGGKAEIYLYGVRNPWRIAFDAATDDLWVADVGQNQWEEITVLPAAEGAGRGANLGWNNLEGSHRFSGSAPSGAVGPVHEYSHDDGCSITGGFVYRGAAIPALTGAYLFADLCTTDLRAVRADGRRRTEHHRFGDVDAGAVISFGEDHDGEILVLAQDGQISRIVPG